MSATTTRTRTLRLSPRHVMTGDLLEERMYPTGERADNLVTWVEQDPSNVQRWSISTLTTGGESTAQYAVQRRLTVKRTGPKGLGE